MDGAARIEAVRRIFEAGQRYITGERQEFEAAVADLCAPDILVVPSSALASGEFGPFRGREALLSQQAAIGDHWPVFDLIVEDYVELEPNTVVVLGKVRARRGDGTGYAVEVGIVNRFENGQIVSIHSYQSKRRALDKAGTVRLDRPPGSDEQL